MSNRFFIGMAFPLLWLVSGALSAQMPDLDQWYKQRDFAAIATWLDEQPTSSFEVLYWRARLAMASGEGRDALALAEQVLEQAPDQAGAHRLYGEALSVVIGEYGKIRQARMAGRMREAFETAVELAPDDVQSRHALFNYYLFAPRVVGGGKRKAQQQAEVLASLSPAIGAIAEATLHATENDNLEVVLDALERALMLDPDQHEARQMAGVMHIELEQWDQARTHFLYLTDNAPLYNNGWYQLGRLAALSGEYLDDGRAALEVFLSRDHQRGTPSPAAAHWRLGMIHAHTGDIDAAAHQYRHALELDPELEDARASLAEIEDAES